MKVSANCPSWTNTAAWLSRTVSLAPYLISWTSRSNRQTMVSRVASVQWMTSMNWPERKSKMGIVNGSFGKGSHRPRLPFVEQAAEDGAGLVGGHAGREVGVVE